MSAYIAQRKNDRVTIFSDAAIYDRDLIIRKITSKIEDVGNNAVMVSRGDLDICVQLLKGVRQIFDMSRTFDLGIVALESQLDRINAGGEQRPLEFILAGVSETSGPVLMAFTNRKVEGMEPFIFHRIDNVIHCGFVPAGEHLSAFNSKGGIDGLGLEMMELSRLQESQPLTSGSKPGYIVGGFVERVDIGADGISRRVVKRWADEIGKPITPSKTANIAA